MIRSALLLCAGIIVAACFACAPVPTPPGGILEHRAQLCSDDNSFASVVKMVAEPFDPTQLATDPPATTPASSYQADLKAAYDIAPQFFKTELCKLDGVFITTDAQSWGFRNYTDGHRYIALSTSLWSGNPPSAIPLVQYENNLFEDLLSWPVPPTDRSPPSYISATPNTGSMTILAALAHEFGHVLWADILVTQAHSPPNSANFCSGLLSNWWAGGPQTGYWTSFGEIDINPTDIPDDDPDDPPLASDPPPSQVHISALNDALGLTQTIPKAHRILWRLLSQGRPFPSVFGAFSANEHFVETFTLYTLMHATTPLSSLQLQVSPQYVRDIPGDLLAAATAKRTRPRLSNLLQCFDSRFHAFHP